jgi:sporulation protein YlmC with PRC-barrel domain
MRAILKAVHAAYSFVMIIPLSNGLGEPGSRTTYWLGTTFARPAAEPLRLASKEKDTTMPRFTFGLAAIAAVVLAAAAFAQSGKVTIPPKTFFKGQEATQYLAKDRLIGAKVLNKDGQVIGDIEDLILTTDNRIDGVIMGVGGFLGAGEKKVGVRYSALKFETKDGKATVSLPQATKEVLAALDPYKRAEPRKSALERAAEKAKELGDKTKETVKDATQKATEAAKDAYGKATGTPPAEQKQ